MHKNLILCKRIETSNLLMCKCTAHININTPLHTHIYTPPPLPHNTHTYIFDPVHTTFPSLPFSSASYFLMLNK